MVSEFEKAQSRPEFYMPPPMDFPDAGASEQDVLDGVSEILGSDPVRDRE